MKKGLNTHENPGQYTDWLPWFNVRTLRYEVNWKLVEKTPALLTEGAQGSIPSSNCDWHYATCMARGVSPLILVGYECPEWHKLYPGVRTSPPKPTSYSAFAYFCKWVAQRCPYARGIQVWNEPNQKPFWGDHDPEPYQYGKMLTAAYEAIKVARPSMPVFSAGTASIDPNNPETREPGYVEDYKFIKRFREGGNGKCDVVAFHAYEQYPQYVHARIDRIRSIVGQKALSCTEYGWTTHFTSETNQAIYDAAMLDRLYEKGVQDGYCYCMRDTDSPDPIFQKFGLLRRDWTAKLAATAFRNKPAVKT